MTYHKVGTWTQKDIHDFEDCIGMWRFEINGNKIRVKHLARGKA
jgi:hypothetical protein